MSTERCLMCAVSEENGVSKFKINADIDENVKIDFINYFKPKKKTAKVSFEFEKIKNSLKFKYIDYKEGKSSIAINDLKFQNGQFSNKE